MLISTILSVDMFQQPAPEKVEIPAEIAALLKQRQQARAAKDWAKSDDLRNQIAAAGYLVKDTPHGQEVTRK